MTEESNYQQGTPIVLIPQRSNHGIGVDLTPATKFGNVEFIFDVDDHQFLSSQPTTALKGAIDKIKKCGFDPEIDYVAWPPSSPLAFLVTVMAIMGLGHQKIQFLSWDRKRDGAGNRNGGVYIPVSYSLDKVIESFGEIEDL